jgi:hypothetical protein
MFVQEGDDSFEGARRWLKAVQFSADLLGVTVPDLRLFLGAFAAVGFDVNDIGTCIPEAAVIASAGSKRANQSLVRALMMGRGDGGESGGGAVMLCLHSGACSGFGMTWSESCNGCLAVSVGWAAAAEASVLLLAVCRDAAHEGHRPCAEEAC